MKKLLVLMLVVAMVLSSLAGCAKKDKGNQDQTNETKGKTTPTTQATKEEEKDVPKMKDGKFDPEVTITVGAELALGTDVEFKEGESIEDNVHTRWAKDELGINIKYDWIVAEEGDAYNTRISLLLAGQDKFPDVMKMWHAAPLLQQLVESEKLMDISAEFDKYASDRIKKIYEANPHVWYPVQRGDAKYGLPIIGESEVQDSVLFIRTDWLENLGLEVPKTIDELEAVAHAFTYNDPNKSGKNDTIGVALAGKDWLNGWMADTNFLYGSVAKAYPFRWLEDENGQIAYGSVQPGMRDALELLNKWYKNGYLDRDCGMMDEMAAANLFTSGRAGIVSGPWWMGNWPLPDLINNIEGADYKAIPMPKGKDGEYLAYTGTGLMEIMVFDKDFKNLEAFLLYLDRLYDHAFEDPDSPFYYGYFEGYDYAMVDGNVSYLDEDFPDGKRYRVDKYFLTKGLILPPNAGDKEPFFVRMHKGELTSEKDLKRAERENPKMVEAYMLAHEQTKKNSTLNYYMGPDTPAMLENRQLLESTENEVFIQIVYGEKPIEAFDDFVDFWKRNGGDAMTREANEWYNSIKAK